MPLSHALRLHAATRSDQVALRLACSSLTYARLWQGIGARLGALQRVKRPARAISPDQPLVALCLGNHPAAPEWLALGLAAPVTLALLDPDWPAPLREAMLERLRPDLVVTPDHADFGRDGAFMPPPETRPEQPFFIGFTSGTTAEPKAFLRDRTSWSLSLAAGREVFGLTDKSHTLAPGPLVHGLTFYALAETLHAGASFTAMARFLAAAAFDLAGSGIQRFVGVPTMLAGLLHEAQSRGQSLPLTQITTAGATLARPLLHGLPQAFPQARITEYYGASELGFVSLAHHDPTGDGRLTRRGRGVGRAFPGVTIAIRENGRDAPSGTIGTIFVKSPHTIAGYLFAQGPHAFSREAEWASVGDLGALDADGNLTLAGRADGMVITGGYNVYPEEIAAVLMETPGIDNALVLGVPDDYLGQRLVALVSGKAVPAKLAACCAARLPRYKVPRAFFRLREWPLTQSGKIARGAIERWIATGDPALEPIA